jgi:hypothetical protein
VAASENRLPPRRRWSEGVLIAIIAATAAISGTIVGAVVTYVGNRQLQDRQLQQEEARQTASTRAVARLLMSEYQIDAERLEYMIGASQYELASYREHTFVSHIGQEDRKLLASHLSEQDWIDVSAASQKLEVVAADLEAHRGNGKTGTYEHETLEEARAACSTAFDALRKLSEGG